MTKTVGILDQLGSVGIKTGYDLTNILVVAAPATLLSREGTGGHQWKIDKDDCEVKLSDVSANWPSVLWVTVRQEVYRRRQARPI